MYCSFGLPNVFSQSAEESPAAFLKLKGGKQILTKDIFSNFFLKQLE